MPKRLQSLKVERFAQTTNRSRTRLNISMPALDVKRQLCKTRVKTERGLYM